ncbi:DUF4142 domain-containing protein [Pseudoxanthomonas gei]|uniref:DUF4142 domain-containing protein n=1 Tax=Pseudoxanthomonas gei TaxID=1383030 RepID=A0ABX0AIB9_9GAMM|nr:DUF4142 domain-containing protein [Pseudoxanthomonas gei]NDK39961.1 DUF4142 domain-containing protein [Pseudoxanthomonas gei]
MKIPLVAMSLLTVALATACKRNDPADTPAEAAARTEAAQPAATTEPATDTPAVAATPAAVTATSTPAVKDALVLGLLSAVDDHEIRLAQQAYEKKVTGAVLDYAKLMEKEHGDNLAQTKTLGAVSDGPEVQALKDKGASELAELGRKSGKEYEAAYVDAMVKGHTDVLALFDTRLLLLGSPGAIRNHLGTTREHLAMHLAEAQKLQGTPKP